MKYIFKAHSKEVAKEQNEQKIKEEIEQSKEIQERMKKAASLRAEFGTFWLQSDLLCSNNFIYKKQY